MNLMCNCSSQGTEVCASGNITAVVTLTQGSTINNWFGSAVFTVLGYTFSSNVQVNCYIDDLGNVDEWILESGTVSIPAGEISVSSIAANAAFSPGSPYSEDAINFQENTQAYPGVCQENGSVNEFGTWTLTSIQAGEYSITFLNPFACSILPIIYSTLPGTNSVIPAGPASGISADGQSAALIAFSSNDKNTPVQINLSATGFSGAIGSLALYDPNFLNESSAAALANTSLTVQSPTLCDNDGNCTFLALLWAPDTMSGVSQQVPLTITATQGTSTLALPILLQPPPLVLVHGIWSSAGQAWPPFEQWLNSNYPTNLVFAADYGRYNYLAFSDPHIQNILESTISNALASAALQGVIARKVDVVGHSMGGLVTRYFMEYGPPYPISFLPSNPVHQLITIGTPQLGTPLASMLLQNQQNFPALISPTLAALCSALSTCTLGDLFTYVLDRPLNTGVMSLVAPENQVIGGLYNSVVGQAPDPSCTGTVLNLLLDAFVPGNSIDGILGSGNDTIVGASSQEAGAAGTATIPLIVHTSLCGGFDTGETNSQAVWTQVSYWLMSGKTGVAP